MVVGQPPPQMNGFDNPGPGWFMDEFGQWKQDPQMQQQQQQPVSAEWRTEDYMCLVGRRFLDRRKHPTFPRLLLT